ncbi:restriction endonuclease subunit S [Pseudomonas citronellolis]|uniref:restriction endonuclease subunit S n=1 Tax=Pseudomonas citronellolis TaxID=53408 RepID=UPI000E2E480B|nr:restriction endonuclease subunit S [Pseudomonas citronellolis]
MSRDGWKHCVLGDLIELKRGYDLPSQSRKDGQFPIVSSSGITGYHAEPKVQGPGVVTGRYGTLGEVFYIEENFWPLNTSLYVRDFKGNNVRFISYLLSSLDLGRNNAAGAVPGLNRNHLHGLEVVAPSIELQDRIADLLSAYDDLIENNTRRIEILEEMARRLYEEWFVQFRFPGHEGVGFKESELGLIPEGWMISCLGDVADEVRDAVHPSKVSPETPYVGLEHLPRRSITLREWGSADSVSSGKLSFRRGDVLFGKIRPYFHKVVIAPFNGICSSDTILIRPKKDSFLGVVLCCSSSDKFVDYATQTSNGTKMPRADWKVLKNYPVIIPSDGLLSEFNGFVLGIANQARNLMLKNVNLRAQRDLLIPKLISGEIDVSDIPMPT